MDIPKALLAARIRNYLIRVGDKHPRNIDIEHMAKEVMTGWEYGPAPETVTNTLAFVLRKLRRNYPDWTREGKAIGVGQEASGYDTLEMWREADQALASYDAVLRNVYQAEQAIIEQARSTPWTGTAPADLVGVIKQYMQEVSARESIRGEGFSAIELGARIMEAGVRQQVNAYQGNEGQGSEAPIKPDTLPRAVDNFIMVAYGALRMTVPGDIAEARQSHLMVILTILRLRVEVGELPFMPRTVPIEIALPEDTRFLRWIYDRLVFVHKENMNVDYMLRLRGIVDTLAPQDAKYGRNDQIPDGTIVEPAADYPTHYLDTFIRSALAEIGHDQFVILPEKRHEHLRQIMVEIHDMRAAISTTQQQRDQARQEVSELMRVRDALRTDLAEAEKAHDVTLKERDKAESALAPARGAYPGANPPGADPVVAGIREALDTAMGPLHEAIEDAAWLAKKMGVRATGPLTEHDWIQLEQAASGCTSGIENWPALRAAIQKVVAYHRLGGLLVAPVAPQGSYANPTEPPPAPGHTTFKVTPEMVAQYPHLRAVPPPAVSTLFVITVDKHFAGDGVGVRINGSPAILTRLDTLILRDGKVEIVRGPGDISVAPMQVTAEMIKRAIAAWESRAGIELMMNGKEQCMLEALSAALRVRP